MEKLAIIGTGIAGMGCAHLLKDKYDLTIFDQANYVGGHTNTIELEEDGLPIFLDTGFMVFNYQTYPNLCALFAEIGAPVKKTDMSFSVQFLPKNLEYSGSGINHLFAQRRNVFNPKYLKMLLDIKRFNEHSITIVDDPAFQDMTVSAYIARFKFSQDMLWQYLIPMSAAVWSAPMEKILDFPAVSLIRFFKNHGFLGLNTQHQWYTPVNGSQSYREILIRPFRDKIRLLSAVKKIERLENNKVALTFESGQIEMFDKVISAAHADETYAMLSGRSPLEEKLLFTFKYQQNLAVVHTDEGQMPKKKLAWSSWNYRVEQEGDRLLPSTIYWMNRLQGVSEKKNYFVSINPTTSLDPAKIIKEIVYHHPLFDVPAMNAQEELHKLNEHGPVYFCGSYFKYGFHEDAYASAVDLCQRL